MRNRQTSIKAFLLVFTGFMVLEAVIDPNGCTMLAVMLAWLAGWAATGVVRGYDAYLDHLDIALCERRTRRMAALAIDD